MELNKIRMIEEPVEEMVLCEESLDMLLGGSVCQLYGNGVCHNYSENATCSDENDYSGLKCGVFSMK